MNDYIPIKVYTQKGVLDIADIVPGDKVFEYRTGNLLEVKGLGKIGQSGPNDIFELKYNDGRKQNVMAINDIFNGEYQINLIEAMKLNLFKIVKMYPVELKTKVSDKLYPDPYIAGALIAYGDYEDEYINLPSGKLQANNLFSHKYNLDYAEKIRTGKSYYHWKYKPEDVCITWKEFFPNYNFFAKDRNLNDPLIPKEYMYASIDDRRKFLSGVFDIGYDVFEFRYGLGLLHKHEYRLKEIQKMLWSLGINSRVYYDSTPYTRLNKFEYKLEVIGEDDQSNTFFYDINHLRGNIQHQRQTIWRSPQFGLQVEKVTRIGKGWTYELILEKHHAIYLDENFLPRVSL